MDSAIATGMGSHLFPTDLTLDLQKAARFLWMHPVTLRNKARSGEIPGAKIGKRWVFLRFDLERYIRAQYPSRALQGDNHEAMPCHSISVRTPHIGGSKSASKDVSLYRKALGLLTDKKP